MERSLLRITRRQVDYPSITIMLPLYGPIGHNGVDPLIATMYNETEAILTDKFGREYVKGVLAKLKDTFSTIRIDGDFRGLAVFVSENYQKVFPLPFVVNKKVIVDDNFDTRDLISIVSQGLNYYILWTGEGFSRLFEAYRGNLLEITENGFPFVNPCFEDVNPGSDRMRDFMCMIDTSFCQLHRQHPMPFVIAGDKDNVSVYREITCLKENLATCVTLNGETETPLDLSQAVWPELERSLLAQFCFTHPPRLPSKEPHAQNKSL